MCAIFILVIIQKMKTDDVEITPEVLTEFGNLICGLNTDMVMFMYHAKMINRDKIVVFSYQMYLPAVYHLIIIRAVSNVITPI